MTLKMRMTRETFTSCVWGEMDWESALELRARVSKSVEWIDYLLMEMELYEYLINS